MTNSAPIIDIAAVAKLADAQIKKQNEKKAKEKAADQVVTEVDGKAVAFTLTEDNIALIFARLHGGKLLFDHISGRWLQYDGARWKPEVTRLAFDYARQLVRGLNKNGKARWSKASIFAAVETIARTDRNFARTIDQFDADPWKLGTPGGIVDLRTGALLPCDPAAMITRITSTTPEAGAPELWLRFLGEITNNDPEVIDFLQRLCGYCLTGLTTSQILTFIFGPGGNGKGVFINVLGRILADYAQAADMKVFTASRHDRHPTELAALRGARLVTASETEQTAEWAESRIKQLTGGDVVRARFMRQDEFEFRPQFKLLIIGNHRPRLRDVGDSMRRRLRMVPFDFKPTVVNPHLEEELMAEAGRILTWMVEGCRRWQADGLPMPRVVQDANADYFESQDLIGAWIESECEQDGRYTTPSRELYLNWSGYCRATGDDPGSEVAFADALKKRGFKKSRTAAVKIWNGLRLKRQFHPEFDDGPEYMQ